MSRQQHDKESTSDIEKEALSIARKILSDEIDILEGSRLLSSYRLKIKLLQDELLFFTGISSQTEEFPTSEAERKLWSQDALARIDEERAEFLSASEELIRAKCTSILSKLTNNKGQCRKNRPSAQEEW